LRGLGRIAKETVRDAVGTFPAFSEVELVETGLDNLIKAAITQAMYGTTLWPGVHILKGINSIPCSYMVKTSVIIAKFNTKVHSKAITMLNHLQG
jgi:hypothetical protein